MKSDNPNTSETHLDWEHLLDEADRLLEQYDFAGSVAAFREAALLAPLASNWLENLKIAEDNERVEFRRRLTHMFPESLDLAHDELQLLGRARYAGRAVAPCGHL